MFRVVSTTSERVTWGGDSKVGVETEAEAEADDEV